MYEAEKLLNSELSLLHALSYEQLAEKVSQKEPLAKNVVGASGRKYQIDINFFYDDKKLKTIRVGGGIYQETESKNIPWWKFWSRIQAPVVTADFIIRQDGTFVGE